MESIDEMTSVSRYGRRLVPEKSRMVGNEPLRGQESGATRSTPIAGHSTTSRRFQYAPLSSTSSQHFRYQPLSSTMESWSFHYSPLSSSPSSALDLEAQTTLDQSISSTTVINNFATKTSTPTLEPPGVNTDEQPSWLAPTVLTIFISMIFMTLMIFFTAMHNSEPENTQVSQRKHFQTDGKEDSPGTAIQDQQQTWQELRRRKGQVVVGDIGSESRPRAMYTHCFADLEKHTPERCERVEVEEVERREVERREGLAREREVRAQWQGEVNPVGELVRKAKEKVSAVVAWFSRGFEEVAERVARTGRGVVGEDPEENLLLPVHDDERQEGEKGRVWLAVDMENEEDI